MNHYHIQNLYYYRFRKLDNKNKQKFIKQQKYLGLYSQNDFGDDENQNQN